MSNDRTFVSYSRADSPFAVKLASDLRANGASVWIDQLDIAAGARWDDAIEEGLRRSARVIVLLSPKAVASQNVLDEVSFAMDEGKTLVPVLVERCTVPMRLRRLQYVDFTSGYETALGRLLVTLGVARTSVSRVATPPADSPPVEAPRPADPEPVAPTPEPSVAFEPSFASARAADNGGRQQRVWLGVAALAAGIIAIGVLANLGGGSSGTVSDPPSDVPTESAAAATDSTTVPDATTPAQTPTAPPANTPAPSSPPAASTPAPQRQMGTAEAAVANQAKLAPAGQLGGGGFGFAPLKKAGDMQALATLVGQLSERSSLTDTDLRKLSEARLYACEVITDACYSQADGTVQRLLSAVCRRQTATPDVSTCVSSYEDRMSTLQQETVNEMLKRIKPG
jgi:hypothetical protein